MNEVGRNALKLHGDRLLRSLKENTIELDYPTFGYLAKRPDWAQEMAIQLGYRIFPISAEGPPENWIEMATGDLNEARRLWSGTRRCHDIGAALERSNITVLEIADFDRRGLNNLAAGEMLEERLPLTRVVRMPRGFQIHFSGLIKSKHFSEAITLNSVGSWVRLPPSGIGAYEWLRAGPLTKPPQWLIDAPDWKVLATEHLRSLACIGGAI